MNNVIDFKQAPRRRLVRNVDREHRHWWRLWFWPTTAPKGDLRRLAPEELRRGGVWGPAVDRGRRSGADLELI
jgi:hypothetical protein